MSRLVFPETFEQQHTLLGLVRTKHTLDGVGSVLTTFLAEKEIDLNADFTAATLAATHHASQKLFMRNAENNVEQRDLKFDPVFSRTRGEVQFLKMFLKPNVHRLGEWGITVDGKARIKYPANFAARVVIVRAIKTKHDSYPAARSPLLPYLTQHGINLTADATSGTLAETFEAVQLDARRDAEVETKNRNNLFNPVVQHLHDIGDYLMTLHNGSQKKLGDYGFTVDDSPRKPRLRTSTVKPSAQITTTGIVLGSTFTNTGDVLLHIYKGRTSTGTAIIVHPNEMLGMTKGFSGYYRY